MLKKSLMALVVSSLSFASQANWIAGLNYSNISEEDINIGAAIASVGYEIETASDFTLVPEFRLGTGITDDSINFIGTEIDVELKRFIALSVRGQYDLDQNIYIYAMPSYANLEIEASALGQSEKADEWEFGLGAGLGYQFSETSLVEASYEQYDGTDLFSVGLKLRF